LESVRNRVNILADSLYNNFYSSWFYIQLMSPAIALLEEFAETNDDVIFIDDNILYRCLKKYIPIVYPRLADMGYVISEIEILDPTDEYASVRFYPVFKQ
jgi:hypothetical protein